MAGAASIGEDLSDRFDTVESLRKLERPGAAKEVPGGMRDGDGKGDELPLSPLLPHKGRGTAVRGDRCGDDRRRGDSDKRRLLDARGVADRSGDDGGGGILIGRGNRGPLFLLRRGSRKKVVVVETVWVVVVVA